MNWTTLFAIALLAASPDPVLAAGGEERAAGGAAATAPAPSQAVLKAIDEHVALRTRAGNGAYRLEDELTGEVLELVYERTGVVATEGLWVAHDGAHRERSSDAYYACTLFQPVRGAADRRYDLDFRVVAEAGTFVVRDVAIHRDGRRVGGKWVWSDRRPVVRDAATGVPR